MNVLVEMQPFLEVWLFVEVSLSTVFFVWQPWWPKEKVHKSSSIRFTELPDWTLLCQILEVWLFFSFGRVYGCLAEHSSVGRFKKYVCISKLKC